MGSKSQQAVKVFQADQLIGELQIFPATSPKQQPQQSSAAAFRFPAGDIRIDRLSPPSERCLPLAVLHTVSSPVLCKLRSSQPSLPALTDLYLSLFRQRNTAVLSDNGDDPSQQEELHLIAMPSRFNSPDNNSPVPFFWCCSLPVGLYDSCLALLNLRCLAIVFDLDETLIVANTMKSFDDRIDTLTRFIDREDIPAKISAMSAELRRYLEDRDLLKQYIETDTVRDNGRIVGVQKEEVLPILSSQDRLLRPVIRLPERNLILTRINPEIRDTSVLVRLRPAWEDLRSYLTAKGRKRFEVFVCTMAERDYALEMWRLLDPNAHLISPKQLQDRVVCVKSGMRKSLMSVFHDNYCHPKMAMVIDDRVKVWDDKDQPRVHVVPPFAPYYAPQAETANPVPVLCVARNVACNVRGGFFKEFDENLMPKIYELSYENDVVDLPLPPDVSCYLLEDTATAQNQSIDIPMSEGMSGNEVEKILCQQEHAVDECSSKDQVQPALSSRADGSSIDQASGNFKGCYTEAETLPSDAPSLYITVLQEIGRRCESKVEFKSVDSNSKNLHFLVEALFCNEKIGSGIGKTRKEAQLKAAENALQNLASDFISFMGDASKQADESVREENGFLCIG